MKKIQFILFVALLFTGSTLIAQQSATFNVSGNCGMCKSRIEKAAKEAGATDANWNTDTKQLSVSFGSATTVAAIQQKIAAVGHDNAGARASDEVYNKLHGCCKYDREKKTATDTKASCCDKSDASSCKEKETKSADCCKDGKCTKGDDCKKSDKKKCSTKDGKCSKPGQDCCKKS